MVAAPIAPAQVAPAPYGQPGATTTLLDPPGTSPGRATSQATMFGFAAPAAIAGPGSQQAPFAPPPGPPPGAAAPLAAQPAPRVANNKQTMIGVVATPLVAPPPAVAAPAHLNPKGTMIGVALPGIAPLQASAPPPQPSFQKGASGTMLGVALPGIAPIQTSGGYAPSQPPQPTPPPRPMPVVLPRPAPLVDDEPAIGPAPRMARKGVPVAYVAGAVFAIVLVFGAIVALLWKGQALVVTPRLDAQGHEQLHLVCDSCPDDTTAAIGASSAKFHGKECDLPMATPLKVGDNALSIGLDRPGLGRDEEVKVVVPIAYRIRADLAGLTGPRPTVVVKVEAIDGTAVKVDGKPLKLDARGQASYEVDVSAQTTGWSDDVRLIDQAIPYSILSPPRPDHPSVEQPGTLAVRAGIATLHLDAPGLSPVIETGAFRIAGRTVKGGSVTVNSQPVTVAPDGTFSRSIDAPTLGDVPVEVRADGPQLASRTARFTVKRVARLVDEARARERAAWLGYDKIMADPTGSVGKATIVEGDVAEARGASSQIVAVIEDARGCGQASPSACLVRVVYGGDEPIARGDHVRVFGSVTGVIAATPGGAPGAAGSTAVPTVMADFAVKGRAGRR